MRLIITGIISGLLFLTGIGIIISTFIVEVDKVLLCYILGFMFVVVGLMGIYVVFSFIRETDEKTQTRIMQKIDSIKEDESSVKKLIVLDVSNGKIQEYLNDIFHVEIDDNLNCFLDFCFNNQIFHLALYDTKIIINYFDEIDSKYISNHENITYDEMRKENSSEENEMRLDITGETKEEVYNHIIESLSPENED